MQLTRVISSPPLTLVHALTFQNSNAFFFTGFAQLNSQIQSMEISEEQRRRDEANRLDLREKRKVSFDSSEYPQQQKNFRLAKCRKLDGGNDVCFQEGYRNYETEPGLSTSAPEKFRVRLEICSPDSFSVTPVQLQGFRCPEERECLRQLSEILSEVSSLL